MPQDIRHTGTHFGVFEAHGHLPAGELRPAAFDPAPTAMMQSLAESATSPLRIRRPAVRQGWLRHGAASRGGRGDEPFVELPWDEALDLAAGALRDIYATHGPAAVYGGSYGWASAGRFHHAQSQLHRFLNCLGGYTASVNTYSHAAAEVILPHVLGTVDDVFYGGTTWPVIRDNTRFMLCFGGLPDQTAQINPGGTGAHDVPGWIDALAARGIEVVTVGPMRSTFDARLNSRWIRARPNTDVAMMLGMAQHLLATGRHDRGFLDRCTTGFDRFAAYLAGETDGQPKTPDWAAAICGVEAATIRELADRLVDSRSLITSTWALQRADHGEQPMWMVVALAAMVGQIGLPGGGFSFGATSFNGVANPVRRMTFAALPQGHNPVRMRIPVARVTEMLENPGGTIPYDGGTVVFPDIRAIYWAGGNPFHHHQDLGRLRAAWKKPDVVIVNDLEWNATARHADIVFPVAGVMEREDIMAPRSDSRLVALRACADPPGEARTDYDILSGLAQRLGAADRFTEGRSAADWLRVMYDRSRTSFGRKGVELPPWDAFQRAGVVVHSPEPEARTGLAAFRADPQAAPLPTPSGRIEIWSDRVASFGLEDCPGHPVWRAPREWLGAPLAARFPLHLLTPQPRHRLHGQLDGNGPSAASKIGGREPCYLSPAEAARRGITEGCAVRIFNDRGAILCGARIVDWLDDGAIMVATGAWYAPAQGVGCAHGNPNVLTPDHGTSGLAQGPSANSALVQAERATGPLPAHDAHRPPRLAPRD